MRDRDTEIRIPYEAKVTRRNGKKHVEEIDPRLGVTLYEYGCALTFFFPPGGIDTRGEPLEIRIKQVGDNPQPWRLVYRYFDYLGYVRAACAFDREGAAKALRLLQQQRRPRHDDEFFGIVRDLYVQLLNEGERRPITEFAARVGRDVSTASRWIAEARRRGLLEEVERSAS